MRVKVVEAAFWVLLVLFSVVHGVTILMAFQSAEGVHRYVVGGITALLPGLSELWWAGVMYTTELPRSGWVGAATHWYVLLVVASVVAVLVGGPMLFDRTVERRRWHDRRQRHLGPPELSRAAPGD